MIQGKRGQAAMRFFFFLVVLALLGAGIWLIFKPLFVRLGWDFGKMYERYQNKLLQKPRKECDEAFEARMKAVRERQKKGGKKSQQKKSSSRR